MQLFFLTCKTKFFDFFQAKICSKGDLILCHTEEAADLLSTFIHQVVEKTGALEPEQDAKA